MPIASTREIYARKRTSHVECALMGEFTTLNDSSDGAWRFRSLTLPGQRARCIALRVEYSLNSCRHYLADNMLFAPRQPGAPLHNHLAINTTYKKFLILPAKEVKIKKSSNCKWAVRSRIAIILSANNYE